MSTGYVCLWRKSIDSMAFANPEIWKLWCLCLMKANHKKGWVDLDGQIVKIEPGQFLTGRYALHSDYYQHKKKKSNKSPLTVWRWLQILEKYDNLNIKSYNKYSIITVVNWKPYQHYEQQTNNRRTTDEQQTNTNNNDKQCIINNNVPYQSIIDTFNQTLIGLPSVRLVTEERKKKIKARWNTSEKTKSLDWWETFFKHIKTSDFLMGKTNKPFSCGFDWILNKSNFVKIIEGNYHGKN